MRAICGLEELAKGPNWGPKHAPIHWICRVSHGSLEVARDPFSGSSHGSRGQKRTMEERPAIDLLSTLGMDELRKLWQDGGGSRPPPRLKPVLLRELAWRIQSEAQGGVDAETRRLLRGAVRGARLESSGPRRVKKRRSRPRPRVELPQGAKLVRTWRGRKHEVTVLQEGKRFSYEGETYESLSEIAEKITSAHWSGPRFFGLDRVRGMS